MIVIPKYLIVKFCRVGFSNHIIFEVPFILCYCLVCLGVCTISGIKFWLIEDLSGIKLFGLLKCLHNKRYQILVD